MQPNRTKSRTYVRTKKRTPGSRVVVHYTKRKPSKAICSECTQVLRGVPNERPYKMMALARTKKRPERAFPNLCSSCSRKRIIAGIQ